MNLSHPVFLVVCALFYAQSAMAAQWRFAHKLDIQTRYDARTDKEHRIQYRLRYYPQIALNENWSMHSFVVTGDDFSSSHNTVHSGQNQYLYPRRLFMRYTTRWGKTELGVIPTYKGRVSSTGLSKDGWIEGLRQVVSVNKNHAFEMVVGKLDNQSPNRALQLASSVDYIELEYSATISRNASYEISIERMTGGNFIRSEYRYAWRPDGEIFFEWIQRLDEARSKAVVGISGESVLWGKEVCYHAYYSHVDEELGLRAELTEDFLGYGHGISAEASSALLLGENSEWFVRIDAVNGVGRLLAGIKYSL
ncbi:hypothetical protein [Aestuariibacter sp. A3R04]|uniref:hypothetical protein n=1 Tax=Aestuariibacter sp. A3R04 TaxID=2841571 RepID=UPI001C09BBFA|nr:hypothetical protein [Aestuariibacter sp. A3R04]MBU3020388.1 hypothetical protein [Aestuariibacter sp. A3R04]